MLPPDRDLHRRTRTWGSKAHRTIHVMNRSHGIASQSNADTSTHGVIRLLLRANALEQFAIFFYAARVPFLSLPL